MIRFGSCRVGADTGPQGCGDTIHNTEQTKIFIQELIENKHISSVHKENFRFSTNILNKFNKSQVILIELCSLKIWKDKDDNIIHWSRILNKDHNYDVQKEKDFIKGLNDICKLLKNKEIIILISHINLPIHNYKEIVDCNGEDRWVSNNFENKVYKINGKIRLRKKDSVSLKSNNNSFIQSRMLLEKYIENFIKDNSNLNIFHIKPFEVIKEDMRKKHNMITDYFETINGTIDTNHYSKLGMFAINSYIKEFYNSLKRN